MNEIEKPVKIYIHKFDLPNSKRIQFEKVIRTQEARSTTDLTQTSMLRNEMIIVIEKSSAESSINSLEKYLVNLYSLVHCVEYNTSLRLNEQLQFSWSSSFTKGSYYNGYSLRYELVMTLVTLGLSHMNRATEINDTTIESNFDENAKHIVNHLKIASGVFEQSKIEIAKWMSPPEDRPLECLSQFSTAMSTLSVSLANFVSIIKANRQGVSHSLISKIACEAWHKAELSKNQLKDLGHSNFKKISKHFRTFLSNYILLLYSLTMAEMSNNSKAEKQYADSLGYFQLASPSSKYSKPHDSREAQLLDTITHDLDYQHKSLQKENELIYFTKPSDPKQLIQPQPKTILTPVQYIPPQLAFNYIE